MKEISQSLYIYYTKAFIFLKDFNKHITYLSTPCVTRDLGVLQSDFFFFMVATAFIYIVYKCNCINSSSKKKMLLKFIENGVACF